MHNKTKWQEMSRKCSHCGHNGHNSRTCIHAMPMAAHAYDGEGTSITTTTTNSRTGIRLFGFDVVAADASAPEPFAMRKSWSMGNLAHYGNPEETPPRLPIALPLPTEPFDGYASDDLIHATSNARERRKGVPWSEEEHCLFLVGLERLGKGDWRGISRNFVKTRTPTQVASHAQKYFLRRSNLHKRRRRSSLFDITADIATSTSIQAHESHKGVGGIEALPSIDEMSTSNFVNPEKMETEEVLGDEAFQMGGGRGRGVFSICCDEEEGGGPLAERSSVQYQQAGLGLPPHVVGGGIRYDTVALVPMWSPPQPLEPVPVLVPVSVPVPGFSNSKIVKPTALFPSGGVPLPPLPPLKAMDNEVVKLSELSLNSAHPGMPPSALSHKLHEEEERGKRHSAFQAINSAMPDANTDLDTPENKCNASISVS